MSLRRIGLAYSASLLNVVSGLLSNLLLMRAVALLVDKDDFGRYTLVAQTAGFLGFAQLGLDVAAIRLISERLGAGDQLGAAQAYSALVRFNRWLAGGCLAVAVAAVAAGLPSGPDSPGVLAGLVVATQAGMFAARPATAALSAAHYLPAVGLIMFGRSLATTGLGLAALWAGGGVAGLAATELAAQWLVCLALSRLRARGCPWTHPPADGSALIRPLLRFGAVTGLGGLGWALESASDFYLVRALTPEGTAAVADFAFWARLPHLGFLLATQLTFSSFPTLAAYGPDPSAVRNRLVHRLGWATGGVAGLAGLGLAVWLPAVLHHWLGGRYDRPDGPWLAVAAGAMVATRLCGTLLGTYWLSVGRAWEATAVNWGQAGVKVAASVLLYHAVGVAGLMAGSAVAAAVASAVYFGRLVRASQVQANTGVPLALGVTVGVGGGGLIGAADASLPTTAAGVAVTLAVWGLMWGGLMAAAGVLRQGGRGEG